jgi:hypothetical protein
VTRPFPFTKAAITRAIRTAQEQRCSMVEMTADGTLRVILRTEFELAAPKKPEETGDGGDEWSDAEA